MSIIAIDMTITNSTIFNNTSADSGGGIYMTSYGINPNLTIEDSFINNNECVEDGGGIAVAYGSLKVSRSSFDSNVAKDVGGAIDIRTEDFVANTTIVDSTFIGNSAIMGGGITLYYEQNVTIINSLFIRNKADEYGSSILIYSQLALSSIHIFETVISSYLYDTQI